MGAQGLRHQLGGTSLPARWSRRANRSAERIGRAGSGLSRPSPIFRAGRRIFARPCSPPPALQLGLVEGGGHLHHLDDRPGPARSLPGRGRRDRGVGRADAVPARRAAPPPRGEVVRPLVSIRNEKMSPCLPDEKAVIEALLVVDVERGRLLGKIERRTAPSTPAPPSSAARDGPRLPKRERRARISSSRSGGVAHGRKHTAESRGGVIRGRWWAVDCGGEREFIFYRLPPPPEASPWPSDIEARGTRPPAIVRGLRRGALLSLQIIGLCRRRRAAQGSPRGVRAGLLAGWIDEVRCNLGSSRPP